MQSRICGDACRTTVVCIDSYENGVPAGRLYNPCLLRGERFHSLTQLLVKMERMLDSARFPQSFTAARSFAPAPGAKHGGPPNPAAHDGLLATFAVRVLFRQNASWQGSVTWLEAGTKQSFRSVLELILLMDSAFTNTESNAQNPAPQSS